MMTRALALVACFLTTWVLVVRAERPEPFLVRTPFSQFPRQIGEWRGVRDQALEQDVLAVLGLEDYVSREYVGPDRSDIGLYVGYWSSQRQGDTIHSPLNCLPGSGWEPVSKDTIAIDLDAETATAAPRAIRVNRYIVAKGLDRQVVLYWYQSHGRITASEYWSRFYLVRDAVRLNRTDGSIVRIVAPIVAEQGEATAQQSAVRFLKQLFPSLVGFIPA